MAIPENERYTPEDERIIVIKAKGVISHYGYRWQDVEDVKQELRLHVVRKSEKLPLNKEGRAAYVNTMLDNRIINMIDERTAFKRDYRHDVPLESTPQTELPDGGASQEEVDLAIDLREALAKLPAHLMKTAEFRMSGRTVEEICSLIGQPRGVVRGYLQQIGRALAPFDDHQKKS